MIFFLKKREKTLKKKQKTGEDKFGKIFFTIKYPQGVRFCPYCKNEKIYNLANSKRFKCASCRKPFRDWTGSSLANFKLTEKDVFNLAESFVKEKSGLETSKKHEISYQTTFNFYKKVRELIHSNVKNIIKAEKRKNFNDYFEIFIRKYRGIDKKNLALYKSEAFWRFLQEKSTENEKISQILKMLLSSN